MKRPRNDPSVNSSWHVSVAAEAIAAAQFARIGLDVSVQYGANQPEYDLIVARGDTTLKVSVKGSQTGSWGLTQSHMQNADYHSAIRAWLERHHRSTVFCLVQFKGVALHELPRVYIAQPVEIANRLMSTAGGRGGTILYEYRKWGPNASGRGTVDEIPKEWAFSADRMRELMDAQFRCPSRDS